MYTRITYRFEIRVCGNTTYGVRFAESENTMKKIAEDLSIISGRVVKVDDNEIGSPMRGKAVNGHFQILH